MAIKESEVSKAIRDWARDNNVMCERTNSGCIPLKGNMWMHLCSVGHPDLVMYLPAGKILFIEVKKPGGVVSPDQVGYHERLLKLGHTVIVVDSFEKFLDDFGRGNYL